MDSSYLSVVVVVVLLLWLWCCQTTSNGRDTGGNHRPAANPILGVGQLGLGYCGVATANPDVVEYMLRANFHNYVKGDPIRTAFADLLGDDLFLANGRPWRLQRKLASYSFAPRLLRHFAGRVLLDYLSRRLLPFMAAAADSGRVFDLQDVLRRFTFDNLCSVAFGVDSSSSLSQLEAGGDSRNDAFFAAFDDAVDISFGRILHPTTLVWKAMKLLDVGSGGSVGRSALSTST
ncbi:hypothetical protein E2562_027372 [Oryza meyeriana var. granulata]|uniref:Cytochrome P450 n=1 Tax=Oryza meyeriana var. granulata TaxID=110450 RepID=A0A6G1EQ46_9ORYZ|nr:hypothetical protein E2562_027372 [Oryza meyeriana var. granulata]